MFDEFFILIGSIILGVVSFFKNFSFEAVKPSSNSDSAEAMDKSVFSRLNLQNDYSQKTFDDNFIYKIRNFFIDYMMNNLVLAVLAMIFVILLVFIAFEIALIYLVSLVMIYFFILYYPQFQEKRSYDDLNQELPYALRHMGIELKSGKGLHDTMLTIRNADYGSLSREFKRVLEEIKYGVATEDSLLEMSHRVKSEGLSRAIQQIIGTLRVGGNLANSLEIIAQDISFDMQIKLKEYSQKLNSFILIYMFLAILAPVMSLIMLMAASTVMGDIISSNLVIVIYCLFFPLVVVFMGVLIKRFEPKI